MKPALLVLAGFVIGLAAGDLAREKAREYVSKRESWTEAPPADRNVGWDRITTAGEPTGRATVRDIQFRPTRPTRAPEEQP